MTKPNNKRPQQINQNKRVPGRGEMQLFFGKGQGPASASVDAYGALLKQEMQLIMPQIKLPCLQQAQQSFAQV
jgi:hypothetical protein